MFSKRLDRIQPSATLAMTAKAADLRLKGIDVLNFSVGEPDFNTPLNIINAAKDAMDQGYTKYTPGGGTNDLKEAVCLKLNRDNNLNYSKENIVVSCGGKHALYNACQVLFEHGDEVIIFSPYWVSFPEFVTLSGAKPILINTESKNNFEPNLEDIQKIDNENVKGIIINSPSNPTGAVWSEEKILEVLKISEEKNWIVISDECYERLVFDEQITISQKIANNNNLKTEIITCMSMSKTYAMTGWRIGYAFGNIDIIKAMSKIQGQATSCANSIGQAASIEALVGDQSTVDKMIEVFKERRDYMIQLLNNLPEVDCRIPGGAFYAFPNFNFYIGKTYKNKTINDSFDLCEIFLNEAYVATIPGDGFGAPGYVRFSYAVDKKTIKNGIDRIEKIIFEIK